MLKHSPDQELELPIGVGEIIGKISHLRSTKIHTHARETTMTAGGCPKSKHSSNAGVKTIKDRQKFAQRRRTKNLFADKGKKSFVFRGFIKHSDNCFGLGRF